MRKPFFYRIIFLLLFIFLPVFPASASETTACPALFLELNGITISKIDAGSKDMRYPENTLYVREYSGNRQEAETEDQRINDLGSSNENYFETRIEHVEIKGRGNSTWTFDKKPYQIKFSNKVNLLGLGKSKTWILLANYMDVCNLRNDLCLNMAWKMQVCFENKGTWVRLYEGKENPRYLGLYYLCHKNKIGNQELNLQNERGILAEIDSRSGVKPDDLTVPLANTYEEMQEESVLILSDSVSEEEGIRRESFDSFARDFNALEQCALHGDWAGVCALADVDSMARYYLFEEFIKNVDAWRKGVYFYRDGESDKIHAGPAWDFDNTLGGDEYSKSGIFGILDVTSVEGFTIDYLAAPVYKALYHMPEFRKLIADCYRNGFEELVEDMMGQAHAKRQRIQNEVEEDILLYQNGGEDYLRQSQNISSEEQFDKMIHFIEGRLAFFQKFFTEPLDMEEGFYSSNQGVMKIQKTADGFYTVYDIDHRGYLHVRYCKEFSLSRYEEKIFAFCLDSGRMVKNLEIGERLDDYVPPEIPKEDSQQTKNPDENLFPSLSDSTGNLPFCHVKGTQILRIRKQKKNIKIGWKKQKEGNGYEIQYSTGRDFSLKGKNSKGKKIITKKIRIKKSSVTSKKIRRPSGHQPLYLRVRVYKMVGQKRYYSSWSKVKKIR